MFVQLPREEMHTMDGRHLIYLASVKAGMSIPQWSEYGADVITSYSIHYTKLYDFLAFQDI